MPKKDGKKDPKKQPTGRPKPRSYSTGELRRVRPQHLSPIPPSTRPTPPKKNPYPFPKSTEDPESPDDEDGEDDAPQQLDTPEARSERMMWQTQNSFFDRRYGDGATGRVSRYKLPERPSNEHVHLVAGARWNEEIFHLVLVTFGKQCFVVFEIESTYSLSNSWLNELKFRQEYPSFEGRVMASSAEGPRRMCAAETSEVNLLDMLCRLKGMEVELHTRSPRKRYMGILQHITDNGLIVLLAPFNGITSERAYFSPRVVAVIKNVKRPLIKRENWIPFAENLEEIEDFDMFTHLVFDITQDGPERHSVSESSNRLHDEHPDLSARMGPQSTSRNAHNLEVVHDTHSSEPRLDCAMNIQQFDGAADQESTPRTSGSMEDSFLDDLDGAADQSSFAQTPGDLVHPIDAAHQQSPARNSVNMEDSLLNNSDRDEEMRQLLGRLQDSSLGDSAVELLDTESDNQHGDFNQGLPTPSSSSSLDQLQREMMSTFQGTVSGTDGGEIEIFDLNDSEGNANERGPEDDGHGDLAYAILEEMGEIGDADDPMGIYNASPPRRQPQEVQPDNTTAPHTAQQADGSSEPSHGRCITMTADDMTELLNVPGDLQLYPSFSEDSPLDGEPDTASPDTPGSTAESDSEESVRATPNQNLADNTGPSILLEPPRAQSSSDGDSEGSKSKKRCDKKNKKKGGKGPKSRN